MYAKLVKRQLVSEEELMHILDGHKWRFERTLRQYTNDREMQWRKLNVNLTWNWVSRNLPGLQSVYPRIAENVARSLDFRMGPYDCLLKAEDTLAHAHLADMRVHGKQDLDTCVPVVLLLYWWMARLPPPTNVDTLYRIEEHAQGWALQWQEHEECPRYHLNLCRDVLLTPGRVLTLDGMITYAGDVSRHVHVNPVTGQHDRNGVPWIWTWRRPAQYHHLRWRVIPPPGRAHVIDAMQMHFNTMALHLAHYRGPGAARMKREFVLESFVARTHVPRLDYNEIVLRAGDRLRIVNVTRDAQDVWTCTAEQVA